MYKIYLLLNQDLEKVSRFAIISLSRPISRSRFFVLKRWSRVFWDISIIETNSWKVSRFFWLLRLTFCQCRDRESRSRISIETQTRQIKTPKLSWNHTWNCLNLLYYLIDSIIRDPVNWCITFSLHYFQRLNKTVTLTNSIQRKNETKNKHKHINKNKNKNCDNKKIENKVKTKTKTAITKNRKQMKMSKIKVKPLFFALVFVVMLFLKFHIQPNHHTKKIEVLIETFSIRLG